MFRIKRLIIIVGLIVFSLPMFIFLPNEGTSDMQVWLEWASYIDRWGPLNAYSIINTHPDYERSDYPPISFVNIALALKASAALHVSWMMGIKIMILGYYLATWGTLIYLSTLIKGRPTWSSALITSVLFLGSFFFVVNSEAKSYLDITYAPWLVLSIAFFARRKYLPSGAFLALAILVKWISILMLPAIIFYFVSRIGRRFKVDYMPLFKFSVGLIIISILLTIAFLLNQSSLFSFLGSLRKVSMHGSSLTSGALNFNWLVGSAIKLMYPESYTAIIKDSSNIFRLISMLIFVSLIITIIKNFLSKKRDIGSLLSTCLMISWTYFIWVTGVHENHLFISVLIAIMIAIINTNYSNLRQYLWLSFFGITNLTVFSGITVGAVTFEIPLVLKNIQGLSLTELLAALQVFVYLFYLRKFLRYSFKNTG